jgi:DNA-binding transcriptional LysR family regulator
LAIAPAKLGIIPTDSFNRTTRSLSLTEEGKQVLDKAKQLVELYDELLLESKSTSSPKGILHVTNSHIDLVEEGIDVALRVGELSESLNIAKYVGALPRIAVASDAYLKNRKQPEKISDLIEHSCIAVSKTSANIFWELENNLKRMDLLKKV